MGKALQASLELDYTEPAPVLPALPRHEPQPSLGLDYTEPAPILPALPRHAPSFVIETRVHMENSTPKSNHIIPLDDERFILRSHQEAGVLWREQGVLRVSAGRSEWDETVRRQIFERYLWPKVRHAFAQCEFISFESKPPVEPYHLVADAQGVDGLFCAIRWGNKYPRIYPYAYRLHTPPRTQDAFWENSITFRYRSHAGGGREYTKLESIVLGGEPYGTLFPAYYLQGYLRGCSEGFWVQHVVLLHTEPIVRLLAHHTESELQSFGIKVCTNHDDYTRFLQIPFSFLMNKGMMVCYWTRDASVNPCAWRAPNP